MKQIVLDTETTGLEPEQGHRIIELGCIEITDRKISGVHFHRYLNPERDIDAGAMEVHRMTREELRDKPLFSDVCGEFLAFVRGAEIIIHNATFDLAFLDAELGRLGRDEFLEESGCTVLDTLMLARDLHPGLQNNLNALCDRYHVDSTARDVHGALLDAELLAHVYLAMTGGQIALSLDRATAATPEDVADAIEGGLATPVIRATPEELAEHERFMQAMKESTA